MEDRRMSEVAIYVRVSSRKQNEESQLPDLERWATGQGNVTWYRDKATGKTMERPGWKRLEEGIRLGRVSTVVVWRLDRLGRTARGLSALFEELTQRGVNLVSLRDGVDLQTPAGRLMAHVLASVAQYETEVRNERIIAGIEAARASGKKLGPAYGSRKGKRLKVSPEQEETVRRLKEEGKPIAAIARATGLSRPTVYSVLDAVTN
jgi:DNA invertase Pin-like site-specific DNA recombinase